MPQTFPDPFGPKSRVATAMTQQTRKRLEDDLWCIHTEDSITQNAVMEHLARKNLADDCTKSIFHGGKDVSVLMVPFEVVMFLKNNKSRGPYKFDAYHKEGRNKLWALWKQGTKTPAQILGARFQGTHKTTGPKKPAHPVS